MWSYPLPALLALCGWLAVFVTPALQPKGWQYMVYAFGTIVLGFAAYLILAWRKRDWPFLPPAPGVPPGPALEPEGSFWAGFAGPTLIEERRMMRRLTTAQAIIRFLKAQ